MLGLIPAPSKEEHARASIWPAAALALLAVNMLGLLILTPPQTDLAPPALRAARITSFETDAGACRAALRGAGFGVRPRPDLRDAEGCGYRDAVALTGSVHAYSEDVTASCAAAAALALWERDVVAPAAVRHLGQRVARIELAGPVYACRRVAGRADRRWSEHASANAIDIAGFTLADGSVVTVERGWRGAARQQSFLRAVRDGACAHFDAVLSPDYNRAHRDHLHLDLGPDQLCH
jgi:hypothetical protein